MNLDDTVKELVFLCKIKAIDLTFEEFDRSYCLASGMSNIECPHLKNKFGIIKKKGGCDRIYFQCVKNNYEGVV